MAPRFRTARLNRRFQVTALAASLAAAGATVAAGTSGSAAAPAAQADALPAFADCEALVEGMRTLALPHVTEYGLDQRNSRRAGGGWTRPGPRPPKQAAAPKAAKAAAGESAGAGGSNDKTVDASKAVDKAGVTVDSSSAGNAASAKTASTSAKGVGPGGTGTNLQERGVDEPDIAKTDGRLLVSLQGNLLRVFDVAGGKPKARGTVNLWSVHPTEVLLAGDRALAIGTMHHEADRGGRWHRMTLSLIDLSDPGHPRLMGTQIVSGTHVSTRLVGGVARVVLTTSPHLMFRAPGFKPDADRVAQEYNRGVVRKAAAAAWLPSTRFVDAKGKAGPARPLVDCDEVRRPKDDAGLDLLTVLTFDLDGANKIVADATSVVAAGELVYASPERLYVATTKVDATYGKAARRSWHDQKTALHSFDITDPPETTYAGSGVVDGTLLGRWAMSEHKGDLRVVTTTVTEKDRFRRESGVVVLRPRDGRLVPIGKVGGLGLGEDVKAVRWFDELAAVVTFRQVDPLYLVDLADPKRPTVRGELKVPGFSQYLHPLGEHRLMGVGQGEDGRGRWGLQVSAFDISDADRPSRTDNLQYGVSGSSSIVERDARHFLYLPDLRTAVLPAHIPGDWRCADDMTCGRNADFSGLIAVRVHEDGNLTAAGSWRGQDASGGMWQRGPTIKVLPLPGGLLAAIDGRGVTILDAEKLTVRGFAKYLPTRAKHSSR